MVSNRTILRWGIYIRKYFMHIRKCDHCKKRLNEYQSKEGIHGSISGMVVGYFIDFDLCNSCAKKFLLALKKFVRVKLKYGKK